MKRKTKFLLSLAVSALFIALILLHVNARRMIHDLSGADIGFALAALLALIPCVAARICRWRIIYLDDAHAIGFGDATLIYFIGAFLNLFLPASSGDLGKAFFGYRLVGDKERMISTSLVDKVIGLSSITLLGFPAALFLGSPWFALLALTPALGLIAMPLIAGVGLRATKNAVWARRIRKHINLPLLLGQLRIGKRTFAAAAALSIPAWIATYLMLAFCFRSLHVDAPLLHVFAVAPVFSLIRMFPFSINGLGTDEMALLFFFKGFGDAESVVAASVLFRLLAIVVPAILGAGCLLAMRGSNRGDVSVSSQ